MASPLKISAKVEIDARQTQAGAKEAGGGNRDDRRCGVAIDDRDAEADQCFGGLHERAGNDNIRAWTGALAAEGLALDQLRAKYNPVFAVLQRYKAAQTEIRTAHAMGALSVDEMTAALSRERQAALASIDAIKGRSAAIEAEAQIRERLRSQLVPCMPHSRLTNRHCAWWTKRRRAARFPPRRPVTPFCGPHPPTSAQRRRLTVTRGRQHLRDSDAAVNQQPDRRAYS